MKAATLNDVRLTAKNLGACVEVSQGRVTAVTVDAPPGFTWDADGNHCLVATWHGLANKPTWPEERREACLDLIESMSLGMSLCEDPDCDFCKEELAMQYETGRSPKEAAKAIAEMRQSQPKEIEITKHNGALWMQVGTLTKCGTDWPIETKIEKVGRRWRVTFGICNGIAGAVLLCATKREALAAAKQDYIERVSGNNT